MIKNYEFTYMYEDELSNDTLYSATYYLKVQAEIQPFFKEYQGFNYKEMKSVGVAISNPNMN